MEDNAVGDNTMGDNIAMANVNVDGPAEASPARSIDLENIDRLSKIIVRKYDTRLIPIVFIAYTIFWLDRSNISLARISGMEKDLRLQGDQFNISLGVFFAVYVVMNIPGNLLLRAIGGGRFLPALIITWGFATFGSGFVKDFSGLCVSRAAVGIAEAGFLGGVLLWLTFFYTNEELIARIGIILSSAPLAGSLGGLMAGGLSRIQTPRYRSWPWIFFIEGALTVVVGAAAFFIMPDNPDKAKFLTPEEKEAAKVRKQILDQRSFARRITSISSTESHADVKESVSVQQEQQPADTKPSDTLTLATFRRAVFHPMTIIMTLGCFMTIESIYAYNLFLPTLLANMGYRGVENPLMTVPPNFFSFIFTIAATQYSQQKKRVALPLLISAAVATVGWTMLLIGSYAGGVDAFGAPKLVKPLQYTGTFFAGAGINAATPLAMSWICLNATPHYLRAIVLGVVIGIGNLSSFVASFTYIKTSAPRLVFLYPYLILITNIRRYTAGHSINIAFTASLFFLNTAALLWMRHENRRRDRGDRNGRLTPATGISQAQHEVDLGWDHPKFRFHL